MNFVLAKFVDVQEAIYTFIQCLKILPFDQNLRPDSLLKFYLLVIDELCNGAAKEVDEQCGEDDDNCVHNVCH